MGKKKEERIAGKSKEDFEKGLKEIYDQMNFKDLMLLRTKGKKAKLSTVLQDKRNQKVLNKLIFTTVALFTVPIASYFVVFLSFPRIYPDLQISYIQTIGGFTALFFVLLICVAYLISALNEDDSIKRK